MTDTTISRPKTAGLRNAVVSALITIGLVAAATGGTLGPLVRYLQTFTFTPRPPDLALLLSQPAVVLIHLCAAVAALALGFSIMAFAKGTAAHRTLGWIYVLVMAVTAGSAFFIRELNDGNLSVIHVLAGFTLFSLPVLVLAARRGDVARHRNRAMGLFFGGLLLAGLFACLPGRLLWNVFIA
jgi:uncharacterized membrane protein